MEKFKQNFEHGGNAYAKLKVGTSVKPISDLPSPEKGLSNDEYIKAKIQEIQKLNAYINKNRISVQGKNADVSKGHPQYLTNIQSELRDIISSLDNIQGILSIYTYHDERLDCEDDDENNLVDWDTINF